MYGLMGVVLVAIGITNILASADALHTNLYYTNLKVCDLGYYQ